MITACQHSCSRVSEHIPSLGPVSGRRWDLCEDILTECLSIARGMMPMTGRTINDIKSLIMTLHLVVFKCADRIHSMSAEYSNDLRSLRPQWFSFCMRIVRRRATQRPTRRGHVVAERIKVCQTPLPNASALSMSSVSSDIQQMTSSTPPGLAPYIIAEKDK